MIGTTLECQGWEIFESTEPLDKVAAQFGVPIPSRTGAELVSRLMVQPAEMGHANSLTSRHGVGRFPYHTDGAHFPVVPRYLVLRLEQGAVSSRPTQLVDLVGSLDDGTRAVLESERWKFGSGRDCFINPILSAKGLRYDVGIMRPAVKGRDHAAQIVEESLARAEPIEIDWIEGVTAIIDNHRFLHARADGAVDAKRVLERVLVMSR